MTIPSINPDSANNPSLDVLARKIMVSAIRKAQGKADPRDFPVNSLEWYAAVESLASDVLTSFYRRIPAHRLHF